MANATARNEREEYSLQKRDPDGGVWSWEYCREYVVSWKGGMLVGDKLEHVFDPIAFAMLDEREILGQYKRCWQGLK